MNEENRDDYAPREFVPQAAAQIEIERNKTDSIAGQRINSGAKNLSYPETHPLNHAKACL